MKRILDTVHGYIMVSDKFIKHIIDTVYFQRLRRIEQTSIRSVYPSARHDRFIHSLGVYHIGTLIVDHLKKEENEYKYWNETETAMRVIYDSYLAACLLHDIGHAPFSHTFEEYLGQKSTLAKLLCDEVNNDVFTKDLGYIRGEDDPNFHEFMSAYIAYSKFKDGLNQLSIDSELVVRMITGTFYVQEKDRHQIHNCFISLLHGKVIDTDRLDYACRDVWASGYSTSSIDLRRLISALHIVKNKEGDYVVCFEANSVNEIEGVLNVKDFQVKYVLNHHVVCYEQWLLKKAAEQMALRYFSDKTTDGYTALSNILDKESLTEGKKIPNTDITLKNLSDDDLIFLMKQDQGNSYYNEWSGRKYIRFALWKSPDEFYHFFPNITKEKSLKNNLFEEKVKEALELQGISEEDIQILEAKYKARVKMDSLYLMVTKNVVRYTDIKPRQKTANVDIVFYYVYIAKKGKESEDIMKYRTELIKKLQPVMDSLYNDHDTQNKTNLCGNWGQRSLQKIFEFFNS